MSDDTWDALTLVGIVLLGLLIGVGCAIGFCALGHWEHGIAWLQ